MNFKETYLQRAWSDSEDEITIEDVKIAIKEIQEMDDEHEAFWVGIVEEDEFVLEVRKDLRLIAILDRESEEEIHYKVNNWVEVEHLYNLFLSEKFEELKNQMK